MLRTFIHTTASAHVHWLLSTRCTRRSSPRTRLQCTADRRPHNSRASRGARSAAPAAALRRATTLRDRCTPLPRSLRLLARSRPAARSPAAARLAPRAPAAPRSKLPLRPQPRPASRQPRPAATAAQWRSTPTSNTFAPRPSRSFRSAARHDQRTDGESTCRTPRAATCGSGKLPKSRALIDCRWRWKRHGNRISRRKRLR